MKIAIFGIQGQLGRDLETALSAWDVVGVPIEKVSVTDSDAVDKAVSEVGPDWVINAAAMTHVDKCETDERQAWEVNALGARHVARAANAAGAGLIQVSTDYVFDGTKGAPYVETDVPRPLNVYGLTKLAGEWFAADACPAHYIVRTSGLYGTHPCWGKGTNFVETMLNLAGDRNELQIVRDEVLTPTFTEDLAAQVRRIIEAAPGPGIYHATNEGQCSWFDFATEIFLIQGTPISLEGITSSQWGAPARRPANSVLENAALKKAGINEFPDWRDALTRYLSKRRGQNAGD
ncbi:MAG: dTDP-4-dehydrorhamnose reductase [Candidatus Latescibacterota bacterium]